MTDAFRETQWPSGSELQAEPRTGFGRALVRTGQMETSIFQIIITLKSTTEEMRISNNNRELQEEKDEHMNRQ